MIRSFRNIVPKVAATAYVDDSAQVIGDVVIGENSSVWPNAVIRGDVHSIRIGVQSNIQDCCALHAETGRYECIVGDRVTVGHNVILHGCRIENDCLIAMGSVVLNNAVIGTGSIVGAGAVVPENAVIPPGSLCLGIPAKVRRQVTEEEARRIAQGAEAYFELKKIYLAEQRGGAK